jgi:hypothetical protein
LEYPGLAREHWGSVTLWRLEDCMAKRQSIMGASKSYRPKVIGLG